MANATPNVSVQIAAVVADSVTVNIQVAVAAAPQPPQEPDDNAGPDVVGDAGAAARVAGDPDGQPVDSVDPDDASSGPPSLVSTSPASTPPVHAVTRPRRPFG